MNDADWLAARAYTEAVEAAGGVPVLLPPPGPDVEPLAPPRPTGGLRSGDGDALAAAVRAVLGRVDALLLTGGGDVDPAYFGQEARAELQSRQPLRDRFEILLVREALARGLPVLGICRGHQVLNIAAGGDLYQDVRLAVPRPLEHGERGGMHPVTVTGPGVLADLLGPGVCMTNTRHHQSVGRVAPGFRVSAVAPDGVVEAIEGVDHRFAVGVQWHPELLWRAAPEQARLFRALVAAARDPGREGRLTAPGGP